MRAAAPVLIGLCFALWGLREVEAGTTVHSDASRHAMNGALIHDYLDSGGLCHPIRYVQDYYSRLPALSLPYHPPLFPAVEALFYAVFGVNLLAARLAVALSVLVCAILLYRLVERASGSVVLAGLVTVCFFALPSSGFLASDVMLEMPALVFTLAALSCLRDLPDRFSLGQGIAFGVLAGAAVWTKQQTVFLGLVPFFVVGLTRRWRLLVSPALWVAGLLLGLLVLLFLALPQPATFQGFSNELPARAFFKTVAHHVPYYVQGIEWEFGLVGTLIIGLSIGWLLAGCWRQDANASCVLPLAWILGQISFLLVIGKYDHRYFFLAYPALVWAALVGLRRIGQLTWKRTEWVLPALAVLLVLIGQVRTPPSSISGPFEAARHVVAQKATRVLYCGQTDGAFIFAIRALAPPGFVVIRGDKTPHKAFTLTGLEDFVQRHGIDFVILEQTRFQERWAHLYTAPPPGLACETEISLRLYPYRSVNGTLRVFRVKASSPQPPLPFGQLPLAGIQEEVTASERNDHHNAPTLPLPGEVGGKAARRSRGPNAAD